MNRKFINRCIVLLPAIACIFIIPGCRLSKPYERPSLSLPAQFRDGNESGDSSIADMPWKSFFSDTTLINIIDSAVAKNFDLAIAMKNIESAAQMLKQSRLGLLPDITLPVTANITRYADNSLNGLSSNQFLGSSHVEDYNAGISVSWEADIWGKIRLQKQAALANYLATQEARKAIQTQLVSQVSQGYYNLLTLDAQLQVAKKNLALNDSTLTIIHLQFDAGQVTALAIEQAQAQELAATQLIPQIEQSIAIQENALQLLSARLPAAIMVHQSLNQIEVADSFPTGLPAALVAHRPDVRSSELSLQSANAQVGVNRANMYPTLAITASGGVNSFKASNWFSIPASLFGVATGSLTQLLFERRQLKTRYELAKLDRDRAVIQFRQSVLTAVTEVSDALIRIKKLKAQRLIASARADTLKVAIRNADLLFRNGMANYLEVITAQANVLQSELEVADLKRQHFDATIDLYRALGGGWK